MCKRLAEEKITIYLLKMRFWESKNSKNEKNMEL